MTQKATADRAATTAAATPATATAGGSATDVAAASTTAAVTFDFWNTLYSADDGGMSPVRPVRDRALRQVLATADIHPSRTQMRTARRSGFDAYMAAWTGGRHFGAREQVLHFLDFFHIDPATVPKKEIDNAVDRIESASLLAELHLLPGVRETIPRLVAAGYRLGVISDTSLTPGRVLKHFLERDGLLEFFSVLTFSDETGYPKPDPRMFMRTLENLGAGPERAAHVGDTPRTDIAGAKAVGMKTVRYAAAADIDEPPHADFVIRDHRELPAILGEPA